MALSLATTAGWTLGAALISAGRILATIIVVVRIAGWTLGAALISAGRILVARIVVVRIIESLEEWGRGAELRLRCCLFDTVLLRGLTTRSLDLLRG